MENIYNSETNKGYIRFIQVKISSRNHRQKILKMDQLVDRNRAEHFYIDFTHHLKIKYGPSIQIDFGYINYN